MNINTILNVVIIKYHVQFLIKWRCLNKLKVNSHAVGITAECSYGFKIDFVRNPISGSAAWFFVIFLIYIFTLIFEIKIHKKKFLDNEKISFSKVDFHKSIYARNYSSSDQSPVVRN